MHATAKHSRGPLSVSLNLDRDTHLSRAGGGRLELSLDHSGTSHCGSARRYNLLVQGAAVEAFIAGHEAHTIGTSERAQGANASSLDRSLVVRTRRGGTRLNDARTRQLPGLGGEQ